MELIIPFRVTSFKGEGLRFTDLLINIRTKVFATDGISFVNVVEIEEKVVQLRL